METITNSRNTEAVITWWIILNYTGVFMSLKPALSHTSYTFSARHSGKEDFSITARVFLIKYHVNAIHWKRLFTQVCFDKIFDFFKWLYNDGRERSSFFFLLYGSYLACKLLLWFIYGPLNPLHCKIASLNVSSLSPQKSKNLFWRLLLTGNVQYKMIRAAHCYLVVLSVILPFPVDILW